MKLKLKRRFLLLQTLLIGTILTAACTDNEQQANTSQKKDQTNNNSPESKSDSTSPKNDTKPTSSKSQMSSDAHDSTNSGVEGSSNQEDSGKVTAEPDESKQVEKNKVKDSSVSKPENQGEQRMLQGKTNTTQEGTSTHTVGDDEYSELSEPKGGKSDSNPSKGHHGQENFPGKEQNNEASAASAH